MAGHGRQHEPELGRHGGDLDGGQGRGKGLALRANHHRGRLMRPIDRELLGHVLGVGACDAGRAHEDERLGRQVDVFLVFGGIAGDRLVTQLGELDADLRRRHPVGPVADDRPVTPGRGVQLRRLRQLLAPGQDLLHGVGQALQAAQQL